MESFEAIDQLFKTRNQEFHGLMACLVYSELDKEFSTLINEGWHSLNHLSGDKLLILAAKKPLPK
ncbi:MAG: hypothetical protein V7727_21565, partial [Sneathiella sp.]